MTDLSVAAPAAPLPPEINVRLSPADLEAQMRVKDVFDPGWLLNPAKVFPLAASAARRAA